MNNMKNSIKREQSQACLNFAERLRVGELCSGMRKNFRLQAKQKILMTLALLITAVGGAWAQVAWPSGDCTVTLINGTLTVSGNGAMADYFNSSNRPWDNNRNDITSVVVESGVTSVRRNAFESFTNLTSVTLPEGLTAIGLYAFSNCSSLQSITIPSTVTSIGNYAFMKSKAISDVNLYANPDNLTWGNTSLDFKQSKATQCHVLAEHLSTYQNKFSSANVTFVGDLKPLATPIEVTTNAAEEGATFTEASFEMPTFDATADYELVRDMSYKVAFSGVPTRARLAKDGNGKFHFADGLTFQLLDNIDAANPKDITSAEGITFMVGEVEAVDFEGSTFYQLDKETLVPLADFLADAHLGNYAICAVASTGEYDGSFTSDRITLFQGYEVTVPAGEFATFYKDEPLYADPVTSTDAKLYTIASVTDDKAVLSDAIETAPKNTPLLVYNAGEQDNTFLLIPADAEPNLALTVAPEFVGTLEATTIAASTEALNNYALNGKQFVWVKDAIPVAANKCWLQIPSGEVTARNISIVFGDATGVNGVIGVLGKPSDQGRAKEVNDDSWYDLNGRKLEGVPTKKGIYMNNGRKVVVR